MAPPAIAILGTGSHTPARILRNDDLAHLVETSDEWIVSRTGIRERRVAAADEQTSDMAAAAGARALADAGLLPLAVDVVIVATMTPDRPMPSTACYVQEKLGLSTRAACFDLNAACSGFLYALDTAAAMIQSGRYRHALVIGAEKLSSVLDWQDRTTCVLFGDGAGAVVLGRAADEQPGLIGFQLGSDGGEADILCIPGGGSREPATPASLEARSHFIKMKGREVFKIAVRRMEEAAREILEQHQLTPNQIACVIPHQANVRIIDALAGSLEIPRDRFFVNLDRYGNTSAASIPLALDEARRAGRVTRGDLVLFVAFGAGLTYGAAVVRL